MSAEVTFGLVHGAWHGAWCWEKLETELHEAGYNSVAMDLPIDDPEATFDDHAAIAAKALEGHENIVLVGHSRGGNVIPRIAGQVLVNRMVFLNGSVQASLPEHMFKDAPADTSDTLPLFEAGIMPAIDGVHGFDPVIAKQVFYHDCLVADADWATTQLRPQRRGKEYRLEVWPDVPTDFIVCRDDRVMSPDWMRFAARNWLGIEPIDFPGGHSPFLSRPHELAETLITLAEQTD